MKKTYIKKSYISGRGIFAGEDIRRGEVIFKLSGPLIRREMRSERESRRFINWIEVGKNVWVNPNKTRYRYFNHSCDPNAAISKGRTVIAIKDIKNGEEITFDYSSTDTDPLWEMQCKCGAANCRKIIGSVFSLKPDVFKQRMPYIPAFAANEYLRAHPQHIPMIRRQARV